MAEINSLGLKNDWVKGGELTSPAVEYKKQAGKYGGLKKKMDMLTNIRNIPAKFL